LLPEPFFRRAHFSASIELVIPREGGHSEIIKISDRHAFFQASELLRMVGPNVKFEGPAD
jgi:hypothetical protein